jgi:UDP-glucose 4-epimerase
VELIIGDILDTDLALKAIQGIDVIVHLAANTGVIPSIENPRSDCETNVVGTLNYLEAARKNGARKFIFASSGAPLGEQEPPINEEKVPKPISPYGASKLAGEAYCSAFFGSFGLKTISLRFGNVYGPRSTHKGSVIAKFIKQALAGETLIIYGDGNQTRDFIYVDDLINAIMAAACSNVGGEVFQIATHRETTVNEIAEQIKKIIEEVTDKSVQIIYNDPRAGEIMRNFSDISKARRMLGWEPRWTLDQGLEATVRWFIQSS